LAKASRPDSDVLGHDGGLPPRGRREAVSVRTLVLLAGYFGDPTDPRLIRGAAAIELTPRRDALSRRRDGRGGVAPRRAVGQRSMGQHHRDLDRDFLFARSSSSPRTSGRDVCRLLAQTIAILSLGRSATWRARATWTRASTITRGDPAQDRRPDRLVVPDGGHALGRAPEDLETLGRFGESLGLAFQLSDDIMDITSTQLELGKEPGTDIREGVYTTPVLHALSEDRTATSSGGSSPPDRPTASCWTGRSRSCAPSGAVEHARAASGRGHERGRAGAAAAGRAAAARAWCSWRGSWLCAAAQRSRRREQPDALLGYGRAGEGADP
jgi:hypothetical protein